MCVQEHAFETTSCAVAAAQHVPVLSSAYPAATAEVTSDVGYGRLETEAILTNVRMRVVGSMQQHHVLSMQAHFRDLAHLLGMLICNATSICGDAKDLEGMYGVVWYASIHQDS